MAAVILALTGYFTGTEYTPGQGRRQDLAHRRGHRDPLRPLGRLRVGGLHDAGDRRRRVRRVPARWRDADVSLFAVALAGCGLLTTVGVIVAMDTFGPVSDNAQGIAEMSGDVSPEGAQILTELDAVGNTTKAITKGIAIATAVLAATALFGSYATSVLAEVAEVAKPATDELSLARLLRLQPGRPRRRAPRRGRRLPVLRPRDQRRRPRRRCGRLRGASPVPGDPRDHGGHRSSGVRQGRRHRHQGLAARAGHAGSAGGAGADRRRLRPRRRARWPASSPARSAPAP